MQSQKYLNLLTQIKASGYSLRSKGLCCFNAQKGSNYNNNLMVVGRAVNGWGNNFDLHSLKPELMIESIFKYSNASDSHCPMKWIEESWGSKDGYNPNKSAFWRVTKKIAERLNEPSPNNDWMSKIVWSNLYKIAPSNGGNPSDSLCNEQLRSCNELLWAEIEEYRPSLIVFFTGRNWFEGFSNGVISLSSNEEHSWVEAHGSVRVNNKDVAVIIAKHPQGKPEAEMVSEILSLVRVT